MAFRRSSVRSRSAPPGQPTYHQKLQQAQQEARSPAGPFCLELSGIFHDLKKTESDESEARPHRISMAPCTNRWHFRWSVRLNPIPQLFAGDGGRWFRGVQQDGVKSFWPPDKLELRNLAPNSNCGGPQVDQSHFSILGRTRRELVRKVGLEPPHGEPHKILNAEVGAWRRCACHRCAECPGHHICASFPPNEVSNEGNWATCRVSPRCGNGRYLGSRVVRDRAAFTRSDNSTASRPAG